MILANRDLASNLAINFLLNAAPQHQYSILLSSKVGNAKTLPLPLAELAFFEQSLFTDIISPLCSKLDHNEAPYLDSFHTIRENGIDVDIVDKINQADGPKSVSKFEPDLIVSIRFGQILRHNIIELPKHGVINLHSGLLPEYRGVMATFWAMLNKEKEFGTTLHFIDSPKIDAGAVISIAKSNIDYNKSYLHNVLSLYPQGVMQIAEAINKIEQGLMLPSVPMNTDDGHYFSMPDEQSINQFSAQGNRLIDYSEIVAFASWFYEPCKDARLL